jgi:hypothetical protein
MSAASDAVQNSGFERENPPMAELCTSLAVFRARLNPPFLKTIAFSRAP